MGRGSVLAAFALVLALDLGLSLPQPLTAMVAASSAMVVVPLSMGWTITSVGRGRRHVGGGVCVVVVRLWSGVF
jgi:cytochrome bd-type quinol oxidase subunit 1